MQSFLYNFRLDYVGSGTLPDVYQSSMILVTNMDATGEQRYRLTPTICHLFYIYVFILLKYNHQKGHNTDD